MKDLCGFDSMMKAEEDMQQMRDEMMRTWTRTVIVFAAMMSLFYRSSSLKRGESISHFAITGGHHFII